MKKELKNIAFIDGQNFYLGTKGAGLSVDFKKFKIYLEDKYKVKEVYYFLGFIKEEEQNLYTKLQKAGFIVIFREHSELLAGKKKGMFTRSNNFKFFVKIELCIMYMFYNQKKIISFM